MTVCRNHREQERLRHLPPRNRQDRVGGVAQLNKTIVALAFAERCPYDAIHVLEDDGDVYDRVTPGCAFLAQPKVTASWPVREDSTVA